MRKTALLAAVLAALPLAALAQTNTAVTSYEFQRLAIDGERVETQGLRYDMSGHYASGIQFDGALRAGEADGIAVRLASFDLRYMWNGAIGPQAGYEHARVGDLTAERITVGLAAAHDLDVVTTFSAALVSDVDAFGDDVTASLNAERKVGNGFTVYSGLRLDRVEGMIGGSASVGSRYGLGRGVFLDGRAEYERVNGDSRQAIAVGVGFSF